jgi:hypothetical protein
MRSSYLAIAAATALSIAALFTFRSEKLYVVALSEVPLYDPATVAGTLGTSPTILAVMKPGESRPVVECLDRKTDIDVRVQFSKDQVAVAGWQPGAYRLKREEVHLWAAGATNSCRILPS